MLEGVTSRLSQRCAAVQGHVQASGKRVPCARHVTGVCCAWSEQPEGSQ